ncbi:OadG family protein [Vibrio parahaemolyticus]|uniref:OadG family protein n=1 Tax=Vibrio parahaemolyticus TaxID=670 RepID=UPI00193FDF1C|nr:OadG family transporter subunit [Vibrio parahaemolyticus]EHH2456186.1 oxaloacetate decarboxylase [Vibrio parahaemolyticus]EIV1733545.1 OadG family protein [Vibrio parahaemolyticus]MBM4851678.1 OadG family protein [Vibrio parahaemolyticus]MDG2817213.1 OadG family transporter subunit [Vibrio parahaemolyticus]WMN98743.1 OadG family transporter subunit [Vibrio parahaemolyticus]
MEVNLFAEGLNLMTLGMGFVFIFLVFLVFAVKTMSRLLGRFHVEPTPPPQKKVCAAKPSNNDNQLVAVIAAAIHHQKIKQSSL